MTDLTFSMPDGREETNKQTNRQTDRQNLAGYFQKKPEDSPQQHLVF